MGNSGFVGQIRNSFRGGPVQPGTSKNSANHDVCGVATPDSSGRGCAPLKPFGETAGAIQRLSADCFPATGAILNEWDSHSTSPYEDCIIG